MGYIHLRNRGRIDVQTLRACAALAVAVLIAWPGGVAGQTSGGAPDGYDLFAGEEWGEERDGLQLRLAAAWAVEERYAADGLLRLAVQVRNTSSAPIEFDFSAINYDIAYEIDGVWYERDNPTVMYPTVVAIPPGSVLSSALAIFVDDRYLLHGLSRIENGARSPLKLAAGPHVIRVRPGPTAFGAPVRNPPASNSVAITFPERNLQVGPSTEAAPETDASLDVLKFAPGPADGVATVEAMLRSLGVGSLSRAPQLADAAGTRLWKPLPSYRLVLPRRSGVALQIPQTTSDFAYIALVSEQPMALLSVRVDRFGESRYLNVVTSEIAIPIARGLQRLATSAQVQQGAYEPRLLNVTGPRGTPPLRVLWLASADGSDDLIYQPTNPDERVARLTRVEFERVYTLAEFLDTARQFVNPPQHDEAWAVRTAIECARATGATGSAGTPLRFNLGVAEAGVSERPGDTGVAWFVTFPESPAVNRSHSGAGFLVYESTGTCERNDISG